MGGGDGDGDGDGEGDGEGNGKGEGDTSIAGDGEGEMPGSAGEGEGEGEASSTGGRQLSGAPSASLLQLNPVVQHAPASGTSEQFLVTRQSEGTPPHGPYGAATDVHSIGALGGWLKKVKPKACSRLSVGDFRGRM